MSQLDFIENGKELSFVLTDSRPEASRSKRVFDIEALVKAVDQWNITHDYSRLFLSDGKLCMSTSQLGFINEKGEVVTEGELR